MMQNRTEGDDDGKVVDLKKRSKPGDPSVLVDEESDDKTRRPFVLGSRDGAFCVLSFLSMKGMAVFSMCSKESARLVDDNVPAILKSRRLPETISKFAAHTLENTIFREHFSDGLEGRWVRGPTIDSTTTARCVKRSPVGNIRVGSKVVVCSLKHYLKRGIVVSLNTATEQCNISVLSEHPNIYRAPEYIVVNISDIRIANVPWASTHELRLRGGGKMNFNGIYRRLERRFQQGMISFKYRIVSSANARGYFNFFLSSVEDPYKDLDTFWLARPPRPADTFTCLMSVHGGIETAECWLPSGLRVVLSGGTMEEMEEGGEEERGGEEEDDGDAAEGTTSKKEEESNEETDSTDNSGAEKWHEVTMYFADAETFVDPMWPDSSSSQEKEVAFFFDGARVENVRRDFHPAFPLPPGSVVQGPTRASFPYTYDFDAADERLDRDVLRAVRAVHDGFQYLYMFTWVEEEAPGVEIAVADIVVQ
eukprot:g1994.t1